MARAEMCMRLHFKPEIYRYYTGDYKYTHQICKADDLKNFEQLNLLVETYFTRLASYITDINLIEYLQSAIDSKYHEIRSFNRQNKLKKWVKFNVGLTSILDRIYANLNHQVPSHAQRTFKDIQSVIKRLGDLLLCLDGSDFNDLEDFYPPPEEINNFNILRIALQQQGKDDSLEIFYEAMLKLTNYEPTMPSSDLKSAFSEENLRKSFFTLIQEGTIPFILGSLKSKIKHKFRSLGNILNELYEKRVVSYLLDDKIENCARGYVFQRIRWVILGNNDDPEKLFSDITRCLNSTIKKVIHKLPQLNTFLNSRLLIELLHMIDGNLLDEGALENVKDCIYFARIEDTSYGRTVYGGYVLINSIYNSFNPSKKCVVLITLIHELAHLVTRRTRNTWDIRFNSPQTIKDFIISESKETQAVNTQENGQLIEQILFGYKPQYVNTSQVNFLLDHKTWNLKLDEVRHRLVELSMNVLEPLTNISKPQEGIFLEDFRCAIHKERTMSMK